MGDGGSSDEGFPDVLQIKPPQPRISRDRDGGRRDRRGIGNRDRESRSSSSKGHYRSDEGRQQVPRRRDNFQQPQNIVPRDRADKNRDKRERGNQRERRENRDGVPGDRGQKRRHDDYDHQGQRRSVTDSGLPGSSRDYGRDDERRVDNAHRDDRSKQLRKSKQKRRHLEEEEERAIREIEERRHKEKKGESRRHSSSKRRRQKSETADTSKQDDDHEYASGDEVNRKQPMESEAGPDGQDYLEDDEMPTVEDIDKSSSELEEGEEVDDPVEQEYHSNVSSESDIAEKDAPDEQPENGPRSGSSSRSNGSESSSSKSDTESDDSSSSDEENSNRGRRNGTKNQNGRKKRDESRRKSPSVVEIPDDSQPQDDEAVTVEAESKPEVKPPDEALLTDVDRAIQQVNLLPPYYPAVQGCRRVEEFSLLNRIEEGTYGVVYRAKDKRTNEIVALKRLKMEKERDGFPITSLREINTLLKAQHENIVTCREIVVGSNTDKIFLVMDYVEHDLKALMETLKQKDQKFIMGEVKCLILQLLRAVAHMHDNWILHRDLKTSNLLLSHKGILKVGDFGLAREYGSPLKGYTPIVVTLWYRAPELLLGVKEYSTPIDIWSVGCIFGELLKMEPMFPGKSEANQLNLIFQTLGTPNDRIWPGYSKLPLLQKMTFVEQPMNKLKTRFGISELGIDLMNKFLTYNPAKRITAEDALRHGFFKEAPLPIDPSVFPTWPAKSELGHKKAQSSPKPPSGGGQYKELREDDDSSGFFLGIGDRRPPIGAGFSLKF